ncbi:hypothetical protein L0Y69_02260 [bacterium]|nr:hypothetical protein [bacterium]
MSMLPVVNGFHLPYFNKTVSVLKRRYEDEDVFEDHDRRKVFIESPYLSFIVNQRGLLLLYITVEQMRHLIGNEVLSSWTSPLEKRNRVQGTRTTWANLGSWIKRCEDIIDILR